MTFLLDTHLLLWSALRVKRLPRAARELLQQPSHELLFSAASIWEIAIKHALGREEFVVDPTVLRGELLRHGFGEVSITSAHAIEAGRLPMIHRDPFDRLLVAQAAIEDVTLLTVDSTLTKYPGPVRKV